MEYQQAEKLANDLTESAVALLDFSNLASVAMARKLLEHAESICSTKIAQFHLTYLENNSPVMQLAYSTNAVGEDMMRMILKGKMWTKKNNFIIQASLWRLNFLKTQKEFSLWKEP